MEAIQSSLYYLHVSTAEDEELKKSIDEQRRSDEESRPSVTIARKPLPTTPLTNHPLPPLPQETHAPNGPQNGEYRPGHVPLRLDTSANGGPHRSLLNGTSALTQPSLYQPAGDYALSPSLHSSQNYGYIGSHAAPAYEGTASGGISPVRKPLPGNHTAARGTYDAFPPGPASLNIARRSRAQFPPVTIIRRDPTSGSQWNIGTITQLEPTFSGSNLHPVCVELTSPGYGRFSRRPETPRPGSAGSDVASIRRAMESATMSPMSASSDGPVTTFLRVVDYRKMRLSEIKRNVYQRTNSSESMSDMKSPKGNMEKSVLAFTSPWQGTCTFVNGIDGKTLKIKHTIASTSSSAEGVTANVAELRFNLPWSLLSNKDSRKHPDAEQDKLPIPKLIESKKENFRRSFQHLREKSRESFQRGKFHSHSKSDADAYDNDVLRNLSNLQTPSVNNLERPHPVVNTPSYSSSLHTDYDGSTSTYPSSFAGNESTEEKERLSLKLGRERAGGGFRGHSAKLGKLIIEDEGLKMCDLVVGAAMGIWWQHYEGKD